MWWFLVDLALNVLGFVVDSRRYRTKRRSS